MDAPISAATAAAATDQCRIDNNRPLRCEWHVPAIILSAQWLRQAAEKTSSSFRLRRVRPAIVVRSSRRVAADLMPSKDPDCRGDCRGPPPDDPSYEGVGLRVPGAKRRAAADPTTMPATASANGTTSGQLWSFAKITSVNRTPIAKPRMAPTMRPTHTPR